MLKTELTWNENILLKIMLNANLFIPELLKNSSFKLPELLWLEKD